MIDQSRTEIPCGSMSSLRRRAALAGLGAFALATVQRSSGARAAKAGKKARKRCRRQRGPCEAFIESGCGTSQACLSARLPCCGDLAKCKFLAFATCFEAFNPM
jgi:hypothetical protein